MMMGLIAPDPSPEPNTLMARGEIEGPPSRKKPFDRNVMLLSWAPSGKSSRDGVGVFAGNTRLVSGPGVGGMLPFQLPGSLQPGRPASAAKPVQTNVVGSQRS